MNQVILTVMKWINDPESVSRGELEDNWFRALDSYYSIADRISVLRAAKYALRGLISEADKWVEDFFLFTGEEKQTYLNEIKGEK